MSKSVSVIVEGTIKAFGDLFQSPSSDFRKQGVIVTTNEQYPQMHEVVFVKDKIDLLDMYSPGQAVKISCNVRGREWVKDDGTARYFTTLEGWKIELLN